jgi:hypothetical protein
MNCYAVDRMQQDGRADDTASVVAEDIRRATMLDILRDPDLQKVGLLVTLLVVALLIALGNRLGRYIRERKRRREVENKFSGQAPPISSVKRVARHSLEEQAYKLLEAIYDLAEGNPGQWVAGAEAAERAGIPFTMQDNDPLFRYLKQAGLVTTGNLVYNEVCKLTPKGVRVMEQAVSSKVSPHSLNSRKG